MGYTFFGSTTKQNGSGTFAVNYVPSAPVGSLCIMLVNRGFGSGETAVSSDFTALASRTTNNSTFLFYRVLNGSEGATTNVTVSNSMTYQMACFTGNPTAANMPASILSPAISGSSSSAGLNWPALTIAPGNDGCLVLGVGAKASNLTSFNTPSPWTNEIGHSITSDAGEAFVWDYVIQNAATNISAGSWTVGGDSTVAHQALVVAILPAIAVVPYPPMALGGMVAQICQ